jgi:malonyl-CoA O-methyltransferase
VITLAADRAYRLWAPSYNEETAISLLDQELATELSPPIAGKRLLDAGCGTGRRLMGLNATLAVGADICREMLTTGGQRCVAVADIRSLPFPTGYFDVIWCRLVLGHLSHPVPAYRELARVCCAGGSLFVSDFHPEAVAAGHRRSFRDSSGTLFAVEHHVHDVPSHVAMAAEAGFGAQAQRAGRIGRSVERLYAQAERMPAYERNFGLPVVAAFLFQRTADAPAHRSQECDNRG